MAKISLTKGDSNKINLRKVAPALKRVRLEFAWKSAKKLDLDVSALLCTYNADGKPALISDRHLVFFNNKFDPSRSVFAGDDVQDGTGQKEQIDVTLDTIGQDVREIAFVITIYDTTGKHTFGNASEGLLKLFNDETGEEILDFDFLSPEMAGLTICHVASLERNDANEWSIKGYGVGKRGSDLSDVILAFNGDLEWFS